MPDQDVSAVTAEDESTATVDTEPAATAGDSGPALGQSGRNAVAAEREARKAAEKKIRDLESQVAVLTAEKVRGEVAVDKGVPADLLTGQTREELEAHAEKLLAFQAEVKPMPRPIGRPRENLRSVTAIDDGHHDARKLADKLFSNR